ncbi:DNA-directed RNA polymerase [Candidatus Woesearchaeota archaeon]|nr:DNA-directed RNA polymerase [Candidatus Woesearchaeota archaeon]
MRGHSTKRTSGGGMDIENLNRRFGTNFAFERPPERHKAKCADCGEECEVPFAPKEGRPVYCRACYPKHRPQR